MLQPYIRRTDMYAERIRQRVDTVREITLDILLRSLTRYGATFDPVVTVDGIEHLPSPGRPEPVLIVGPHMMLGLIIFRMLRDRGCDFVGIMADEQMRVPGTRDPMPVEPPSPELLLRARRHLREGRVVVTAIDRADAERRNAVYQTRRGDLRVSSALLQVAASCGARILFIATWLDERSRIVMRLVPARAADAGGVLEEFLDFVDATPAPAPASPP